MLSRSRCGFARARTWALRVLGADPARRFAGLVPAEGDGRERCAGRGTIGRGDIAGRSWSPRAWPLGRARGKARTTGRKRYGGGAAAQPDADGGTACLALIARTGAPRGAAPPHSVTIQACPIHVQVVTSKTQRLFGQTRDDRRRKCPATAELRVTPGVAGPGPGQGRGGTGGTGWAARDGRHGTGGMGVGMVPDQPKLNIVVRGGYPGLPREPKGAGVAWAEERRRSDEGPPPKAARPARRRLKRRPEASGKIQCSAIPTCCRPARTRPRTGG